MQCRGRSREPRLRSNKTANAILTSVCEFLRFASTRGWFPPELVEQLSEPKYLRRGPVGYDFGEDDQFRTVPTNIARSPRTECFAVQAADCQRHAPPISVLWPRQLAPSFGVCLCVLAAGVGPLGRRRGSL